MIGLESPKYTSSIYLAPLTNLFAKYLPLSLYKVNAVNTLTV
ncbi:hypothetical protein yberc0001_22120 [Yersinia bercovieri ATCC 43970]|uniref:Uncharacterized protein n=1 Tax=Yersinia bercovieri ATCC 43970 TaxID=349968 RepID=A0ABM9Y433_YERBE|nr:hypothetical protein yberc0001_22120 [Yersinia bercovieri ATCC 43970]